MALINQLSNTAKIVFDGVDIVSNAVITNLTLPPGIIKEVDKLVARIGDTLTYTITITNPSLVEIKNLPFSDTIPAGTTYKIGTFKVDSAAATPTVAGKEISYTIPSIAAVKSIIIQFDVDVVGGTA